MDDEVVSFPRLNMDDDEVVSIHLHNGANSSFPTFKGLIEKAIRARGLEGSWRLTASPADPVPRPLDIAVMTGRSLTRSVQWLAEHRPKRLIIPHAGIPPGVQAALEEAGCGGIPVYNLHHNNKATGELGVALLLALSRKTTVADRLCRQGDWSFYPMDKRSFKESGVRASRLVYNSCVLVVGHGAVGSYVAGVLRAMGSRVMATKRTVAAEKQVREREGSRYNARRIPFGYRASIWPKEV